MKELPNLEKICKKFFLTFQVFRKKRGYETYIVDFKSTIKENTWVRFLNTHQKKGKLFTALQKEFSSVSYLGGFGGYCCTLELGE